MTTARTTADERTRLRAHAVGPLELCVEQMDGPDLVEVATGDWCCESCGAYGDGADAVEHHSDCLYILLPRLLDERDALEERLAAAEQQIGIDLQDALQRLTLERTLHSAVERTRADDHDLVTCVARSMTVRLNERNDECDDAYSSLKTLTNERDALKVRLVAVTDAAAGVVSDNLKLRDETAAIREQLSRRERDASECAVAIGLDGWEHGFHDVADRFAALRAQVETLTRERDDDSCRLRKLRRSLWLARGALDESNVNVARIFLRNATADMICQTSEEWAVDPSRMRQERDAAIERAEAAERDRNTVRAELEEWKRHSECESLDAFTRGRAQQRLLEGLPLPPRILAALPPVEVVERLREVDKAATSGPWRVSMSGYSVKSDDADMPIVAAVHGGAQARTVDVERWSPNADVIVGARNALPALLALVDAVRGNHTKEPIDG